MYGKYTKNHRASYQRKELSHFVLNDERDQEVRGGVVEPDMKPRLQGRGLGGEMMARLELKVGAVRVCLTSLECACVRGDLNYIYLKKSNSKPKLRA